MKIPITQNNFIVPYHTHNGVDSPLLPGGVTSFFALSGVLTGSKAFALGTVSNGDIVQVSLAIPGTELGDFVLVSYSTDLQSMNSSGYVASAGLVTAVFFNNSGFSVTISPGTISFVVINNT